MHPDQTVSEMAKEVIRRRAETLADQSGQPFEWAMSDTLKSDAARQLRELAESEYGEWKAAQWQARLPWVRRGTPLLVAGVPYGLAQEQRESARVSCAAGGRARQPERMSRLTSIFIYALIWAEAPWALPRPQYLYGVASTCEHHRERYAIRQMCRP